MIQVERLQKKIASLGYTSRRKAEELITQGRVRVNDSVVTELGVKVKNNDKIYIDDVLLVNSGKVYYLLNKPRGVVCTTSDDKNRKTITSLIETDVRIFPVGRLDYDTTGAIILTNDGTLSNILTSSANEVNKRYIAKVKGLITPYQIKCLKEGLVIDNIKLKKCKAKVKRYDKKTDTSILCMPANWFGFSLVNVKSKSHEGPNFSNDLLLYKGSIKFKIKSSKFKVRC